jgi:hypothetical protein
MAAFVNSAFLAEVDVSVTIGSWAAVFAPNDVGGV